MRNRAHTTANMAPLYPPSDGMVALVYLVLLKGRVSDERSPPDQRQADGCASDGFHPSLAVSEENLDGIGLGIDKRKERHKRGWVEGFVSHRSRGAFQKRKRKERSVTGVAREVSETRRERG